MNSVAGILLAAGHSRRFGSHDKLMQLLPDGGTLAGRAAYALHTALPHSLAVVREDNLLLQQQLRALGMQIVLCGAEAQEMSTSLVAGVCAANRYFPDAAGYVVALADMPAIQPGTIAAIGKLIVAGHGIVVPTWQGKRGHPVGFARKFYDELLQVRGDQGARGLLKQYADEIRLLPCNDAGIVLDVDTPNDFLNLMVERQLK